VRKTIKFISFAPFQAVNFQFFTFLKEDRQRTRRFS